MTFPNELSEIVSSLVLQVDARDVVNLVGEKSFCGLGAVSEAALQRMAETECNSIYLNDFGDMQLNSQLIPFIKNAYPSFDVVTVSGHFHYPKGGHMGWHTNSDAPGKRVYLVWSDAGDSFFRYQNKQGQIVTLQDKPGLNIYEFDIPEPPELFWHCIYSNCNRYSFGFRLERE